MSPGSQIDLGISLIVSYGSNSASRDLLGQPDEKLVVATVNHFRVSLFGTVGYCRALRYPDLELYVYSRAGLAARFADSLFAAWVAKRRAIVFKLGGRYQKLDLAFRATYFRQIGPWLEILFGEVAHFHISIALDG